jgi:hypothetical protein
MTDYDAMQRMHAYVEGEQTLADLTRFHYDAECFSTPDCLVGVSEIRLWISQDTKERAHPFTRFFMGQYLPYALAWVCIKICRTLAISRVRFSKEQIEHATHSLLQDPELKRLLDDDAYRSLLPKFLVKNMDEWMISVHLPPSPACVDFVYCVMQTLVTAGPPRTTSSSSSSLSLSNEETGALLTRDADDVGETT